MFSLLKKSSARALPEFGGLAGWSHILRQCIPALRRRASAGGGLEHLGSLALTAQASLALVRWRDRTLLLGVTPQGISLLTQGEEPTSSQDASCKERNL